MSAMADVQTWGLLLTEPKKLHYGPARPTARCLGHAIVHSVALRLKQAGQCGPGSGLATSVPELQAAIADLGSIIACNRPW